MFAETLAFTIAVALALAISIVKARKKPHSGWFGVSLVLTILYVIGVLGCFDQHQVKHPGLAAFSVTIIMLLPSVWLFWPNPLLSGRRCSHP